MDETHRKIIIDNIENLVKLTNYEKLMEQCLERKMLFEEMKQDIENYPYPSKRHQLLFEKITRRGPKAFNTFLIICEQHFPRAANILKRSPTSAVNTVASNANTINDEKKCVSIHYEKIRKDGNAPLSTNINNNNNQIIILEPFNLPIEPKVNLPIQKSDKFHSDPKLPTYKMESKNRGVFFLVNIINFINNKYRIGANVDRDNLIHLFRGLGFQIFYYEDIDKTKLIELIKELKESQYLRPTDCFFFTILTHGAVHNGNLMAEFTNGSFIKIETIVDHFNNKNCFELIGKPKIFMFPFCRGPTPDPGVNFNRNNNDNTIETDGLQRRRFRSCPLPTMSDMKILYGTVPGYETFRHPEFGSWYIECFCQVFAERAHDTSLDDLIKMIGNKIMELSNETIMLMTPNDEGRGFFKALFFNPGFY